MNQQHRTIARSPGVGPVFVQDDRISLGNRNNVLSRIQIRYNAVANRYDGLKVPTAKHRMWLEPWWLKLGHVSLYDCGS
jgi:hypothetical protein